MAAAVRVTAQRHRSKLIPHWRAGPTLPGDSPASGAAEIPLGLRYCHRACAGGYALQDIHMRVLVVTCARSCSTRRPGPGGRAWQPRCSRHGPIWVYARFVSPPMWQWQRRKINRKHDRKLLLSRLHAHTFIMRRVFGNSGRHIFRMFKSGNNCQKW